MADKKITQLTNITGADLVDADEFVVVDISADETKAITLAELKTTLVQTGAEIKAAYEVEASAFTDAQFTKLAGIETAATADQTGAQIKAAYEAETNAFTDAQFTKLSGIEASADVTDATNVTAAGALMDSEVTNLAQVKAFSAADYATAAQGTLATNALPKGGGAMTGAITTSSTFDGRDVSVDGAKLDGIAAGATNTVGNATHTGEVTGSGALTIADNVVDEANLKVSNAPTNGYFLSAQSGNTGGMTWAQAGGNPYTAQSTSSNGYITLVGGIIFQWGSLSFPDATVSSPSYPIAFPNGVFQVVGIQNGVSGNVVLSNGFVLTSIGSTSFSVRNVTGQTHTFRWMAVGY